MDRIEVIARFVIEIALIYLGLLTILGFVRGQTGEGALKGVAIAISITLVAFYLIATNFRLYRIELLLEKVLEYLLLVLIIIFQPELRRGFITLGRSRIFGRLAAGRDDWLTVLSQAVFRLARQRTGALIVIERGVGLGNYAERGIPIDARLSPELVDSIFFPGNPLHDGGAIVRGSRVIAAGCLFPLTDNLAVSKRLGTRHRAAIGISEETDAISVVVSEETGRVSVAIRGELFHDLDREAFAELLRVGLRDAVPESSLNGGKSA